MPYDPNNQKKNINTQAGKVTIFEAFHMVLRLWSEISEDGYQSYAQNFETDLVREVVWARKRSEHKEKTSLRTADGEVLGVPSRRRRGGAFVAIMLKEHFHQQSGTTTLNHHKQLAGFYIFVCQLFKRIGINNIVKLLSFNCSLGKNNPALIGEFSLIITSSVVK